jgi:hypothetical protein
LLPTVNGSQNLMVRWPPAKACGKASIRGGGSSSDTARDVSPQRAAAALAPEIALRLQFLAVTATRDPAPRDKKLVRVHQAQYRVLKCTLQMDRVDRIPCCIQALFTRLVQHDSARALVLGPSRLHNQNSLYTCRPHRKSFRSVTRQCRIRNKYKEISQ